MNFRYRIYNKQDKPIAEATTEREASIEAIRAGGYYVDIDVRKNPRDISKDIVEARENPRDISKDIVEARENPRDISKDIVEAWWFGKKRKIGNSETDGRTLWVYGKAIARETDTGYEISTGGWASKTIKDRLNAINDVNVKIKAGQLYLNGKLWDGSWVDPTKYGLNFNREKNPPVKAKASSPKSKSRPTIQVNADFQRGFLDGLKDLKRVMGYYKEAQKRRKNPDPDYDRESDAYKAGYVTAIRIFSVDLISGQEAAKLLLEEMAGAEPIGISRTSIPSSNLPSPDFIPDIDEEPEPESKSTGPEFAPKPGLNKKQKRVYKAIPKDGTVVTKSLLFETLDFDIDTLSKILKQLQKKGKIGSKLGRAGGFYRIKVKETIEEEKEFNKDEKLRLEETIEEDEELDEDDIARLQALVQPVSVPEIKSVPEIGELVEELWDEFVEAAERAGEDKEYIQECKDEVFKILESGKIPVGLVGKLYGGEASAVIQSMASAFDITTFKAMMAGVLSISLGDFEVYPLIDIPEYEDIEDEDEDEEDIKIPNPYVQSGKDKGWIQFG